MNEFQQRLLAQTGLVGDQLFKRRLLLLLEQQLVSDKAKSEALSIIWSIVKMRKLSPFPAEASVNLAPLETLKTELTQESADAVKCHEDFVTWLKTVSDELPAGDGDRPENDTESALNGRMRDNLNGLRIAVDSTRTRLLIAGEDYDREAYTSARNALTFGSTVYDEKLRLDLVQATNEECARVEDHIDKIKTAAGANFPSRIRDAAIYLEERVVLPA